VLLAYTFQKRRCWFVIRVLGDQVTAEGALERSSIKLGYQDHRCLYLLNNTADGGKRESNARDGYDATCAARDADLDTPNVVQAEANLRRAALP
jgi:hypothetical protein